MDLRVRLDELLPVKIASQRLPEALRRLDSGEADQLVITRRNEPRAVLITVERYEELLSPQTSKFDSAGHRGDGP
jgi:prevent-host-death family protein